MATGAQTVQVKVELDAEAFQDAVQDAIDRAARGARVTPTEHVHPEDVKVGDVLMVAVRVTAVRPPRVGGDPSRPHIFARTYPGPWAINEGGQVWTHGWSIEDAVDARLEKVVRS